MNLVAQSLQTLHHPQLAPHLHLRTKKSHLKPKVKYTLLKDKDDSEATLFDPQITHQATQQALINKKFKAAKRRSDISFFYFYEYKNEGLSKWLSLAAAYIFLPLLLGALTLFTIYYTGVFWYDKNIEVTRIL